MLNAALLLRLHEMLALHYGWMLDCFYFPIKICFYTADKQRIGLKFLLNIVDTDHLKKCPLLAQILIF